MGALAAAGAGNRHAASASAPATPAEGRDQPTIRGEASKQQPPPSRLAAPTWPLSARGQPALNEIPENAMEPTGWQPLGLFSLVIPAVTVPDGSIVTSHTAE